ncbi:hypothetical protein Daesc_007068 [Daldinia eschscholtzii]|uniref:DUF6594 domain-containing protein n=1 Tax=Daldinia eschscholtzii TaxID=292717 RepID=A0AAX6MIK8_9PEZI
MMDYASSPQREPPETTIETLVQFCRKHVPVTNEKEEYYLYKEDLVSLKSREETARVDKFITEFLYNKPHKLIEESTRQNGGVTVLSTGKIGATVEVILVLTIVLLLLWPIYPLYLLCQSDITTPTLVLIMLIQFGSTGSFTYCLNYVTRPKRQELFAYSAGSVLSLFIKSNTR